MKKILTLVAFLPMLLLSLCAVSCGSDDDGTNPPGGGGDGETKAADIALYTFTSASAEYASLEFTEDSRYILVKKSTAGYIAPLRSEGLKTTCFANAAKASKTRASESDGTVVVGKLTKNNNTYVLDGFGTAIIVVKDQLVTVTITENGKKEQVLNATMTVPTGKESDFTNKLCHTWKITKITYKTPEGSITGTPEELAKMEGEDSAPAMVTMSKVGTYMVTSTDGFSEVAHWRWSDESKGIMQYSWTYTATSTDWNSKDSGFATVTFEGETAVVTENFEDGETIITYGTRIN